MSLVGLLGNMSKNKLSATQEKRLNVALSDYHCPECTTICDDTKLKQHLVDELEREREEGFHEGLESANENWRENILPANLSRQKKELLKELSLCNDCYKRNND